MHGHITDRRHTRTVRLVADLPAWLLLLTLVYGPLALGSTPVWAVAGLNVLTGATLVLWALSWVVRRRLPRIPSVLALCVAYLLLQGWWMVLNAPGVYDPAARTFQPTGAPWPAATGAVEPVESRHLMLRLTGILGLLCFVSDLGQRPAWRLRLWWTVLLAGGTLAAFGLIQRLAPLYLVARQMERHQGFPFGTFNYHGNAGAYLNLVTPMAAGLFAVSLRCRAPTAALAALGAILLLLVTATLVTASKAAVLIAAVLLVVLYRRLLPPMVAGTPNEGADGPHVDANQSTNPQTRRGAVGEGRRRRRIMPWAVTVVGVALAGGLAWQAGGRETWRRWDQFFDQHQRNPLGENARVLMWRVAWPMAREAGAFGYGPGSFKLLLPQTEHMVPALYRNWIVHEHTPGGRASIWGHAHQDFLQTVIEWGWVGAAVWVVLVVGAVRGLVIRRLGDGPDSACPDGHSSSSQDDTLTFCVGIALVGVLIHAAIDFPLQVASIQLYVAVYLGLGWGRSKWLCPEDPALSAGAVIRPRRGPDDASVESPRTA